MYRLYRASEEGDVSSVAALLAEGVSTEWRHPLTSKTPLLIAVENSNSDVAITLVSARANIHAHDRNHSTAIYLAAANGLTELGRFLLNQGANSNVASTVAGRLMLSRLTCYAPLHECAHHGYVELTELLVNAGADVDAVDYTNMTPLHVASMYGQSDVARVLIKAGANVNAQDRDGDTPIIIALNAPNAESIFTSGHAALTKLLIESGCNLELHNDIGATALSIAEGEQRADMVTALQQAPLDRALQQAREADLLTMDCRIVRRGVAAARRHGISATGSDIVLDMRSYRTAPESARSTMQRDVYDELETFAKRAEAAQGNTWEALRQLIEHPPLALDCITFAACARICGIRLGGMDAAESQLVTDKAKQIKARQELLPGQRIRIRKTSSEEAKRLAVGHGGWNLKMSSQLGSEGTVVEIDADGDVHVDIQTGLGQSDAPPSGSGRFRFGRLGRPGSGRQHKVVRSGVYCWNPTMIEALDDQLQAMESDPISRRSGTAKRQAAAALLASRCGAAPSDVPFHHLDQESPSSLADDPEGFDEEYTVFVERCSSSFLQARRLQAAATRGTSCVFYFLDAERIRHGDLALFEPLQKLRATHPHWVKEMEITIEDACSGRFAEDHMACSHRYALLRLNRMPFLFPLHLAFFARLRTRQVGRTRPSRRSGSSDSSDASAPHREPTRTPHQVGVV